MSRIDCGPAILHVETTYLWPDPCSVCICSRRVSCDGQCRHWSTGRLWVSWGCSRGLRQAQTRCGGRGGPGGHGWRCSKASTRPPSTCMWAHGLFEQPSWSSLFLPTKALACSCEGQTSNPLRALSFRDLCPALGGSLRVYPGLVVTGREGPVVCNARLMFISGRQQHSPGGERTGILSSEL